MNLVRRNNRKCITNTILKGNKAIETDKNGIFPPNWVGRSAWSRCRCRLRRKQSEEMTVVDASMTFLNGAGDSSFLAKYVLALFAFDDCFFPLFYHKVDIYSLAKFWRCHLSVINIYTISISISLFIFINW